ncbi:MAG: MFS transporter, partial [Acidobacteria bacterium]|nr:MFS transporter [Acidobacteriota bacterium]
MTSRQPAPPAESHAAAKLKNNPREIFGWKMYDWANSAFSTTVVGALLSPYLTRLAQEAVGKNGTVLD